MSDRLVLLNPGPVNTDSRTRAAMASDDACHREPEAAALMDRVRSKAANIAGGQQDHDAVLLGGSGTAALEAAVSSVVPSDGRLLILSNGHYAERMTAIAELHGIATTVLDFGWCNPIDIAAVRLHLETHDDISHVGLVHHETSTGMLNPLRPLGALVHEFGRELIVDAISSLGCEEVHVELDHIDWLVGTANKCLEGLPGVSFVVARRESLRRLDAVPRRSYYLDLHGHWQAQILTGAPLFTPPLQVVAAFEVALDLAIEEGTANRHNRYLERATSVRNGLSERGAKFLLDERDRAVSTTNVFLPSGVSYEFLHDALKSFGFVIYAAQKVLPGVYRVANMGQISARDIERFLEAYDSVMSSASSPQNNQAYEEV